MIKEKVERRAGESQDKWFVKLQLLKVAAPCSPLLFVPACLSGSVQKCKSAMYKLQMVREVPSTQLNRPFLPRTSDLDLKVLRPE